jgi:hypothetical protein
VGRAGGSSRFAQDAIDRRQTDLEFSGDLRLGHSAIKKPAYVSGFGHCCRFAAGELNAARFRSCYSGFDSPSLVVNAIDLSFM